MPIRDGYSLCPFSGAHTKEMRVKPLNYSSLLAGSIGIQYKKTLINDSNNGQRHGLPGRWAPPTNALPLIRAYYYELEHSQVN
jgi:hypothetical protein